MKKTNKLYLLFGFLLAFIFIGSSYGFFASIINSITPRKYQKSVSNTNMVYKTALFTTTGYNASGVIQTGGAVACLNCSGSNYFQNAVVGFGALIDSSGNSYIQRGQVSTGVAGGNSDILLMSQKAISGFVNNKLTSSGNYLVLYNAYAYSGSDPIINVTLSGGDGFSPIYGSIKGVNNNNGPYTATIYGYIDNTYYNTNGKPVYGISSLSYGGTSGQESSAGYYVDGFLNNSVIRNSNALRILRRDDFGSTKYSYGPVLLLNDTTTGTGSLVDIQRGSVTKFKINSTGDTYMYTNLYITGSIAIGNNTSTCTGQVAGTIMFSGDNFYGCKLASGRTLLN